jgi:hypothetical protein
MDRTLREKIHNPFNWTCNCAEDCWCVTTRWGRALMWTSRLASTASRPRASPVLTLFGVSALTFAR